MPSASTSGQFAAVYDSSGGVIVFWEEELTLRTDAAYYLWNLLVISLALPRLPGDVKPEIGKGQRLLFCLFITLLGIIIDWAYFELTWDTDFGKYAIWAPATSQSLQFVWLLLPMAMIFLCNAALSYAYLKLERKPAVIFGAIMGVFTAPWLLPILPYAFGWVV